MKKSKKILAGVMAVCLIGGISVIPESIAPVVSVAESAEEASKSGTCGENVTWVLDDEGTLTISGTGNMESTPWRSVYGVPIKKVIIKNGVTNIEDYAFNNYSNLTEVTIPDSVTRIGDGAISYCKSLESVNISENNKVYSSIDGVIFNKDKTEIIYYPDGKNESFYIIPDGIITIGTDAFSNCTNLESVTIPDSVTTLGIGTFSNCTNLKSVTIPDSVTSISSITFWNCTELTSVKIPDSVTNIDGQAFEGCTNLKEIVIPDGVTDINSHTFNNCNSLTSVTIPDSVTSIGYGAFENCTSLTSVTIPNSVTSIDNGAFSGCSNLISINIPENVTEIGDSFDGTLWLEEKRKENPLVIVNGILIDGSTCSGDVVIPDGITNIMTGMFDSCENLTSITIPDSVTSIGQRAFYGCSNLTETTIPDNVTDIGAYAFEGTEWLKQKRAENSLVIVNNILVDGRTCSGDVVITDNVTRINNCSFVDSTLTSITIPDSVTSIGNGAFAFCQNLESIIIPESVTEIESSISYWAGLKSITILNPKCDIDDYGFATSEGGAGMNFINTICGYDNSTAQEYAEKHNCNFESLGKATKKETATGDANGDNKINMSDAVLIMQSISNPSEYKISDSAKLLADVVDKGDGLTGKDALAIQMIEAKLLSIEDLPITSDELNSLIK